MRLPNKLQLIQQLAYSNIIMDVHRLLQLHFRLQHQRRMQTWLALQHRPSQETPCHLGYWRLLLLLML